MYNDSRGGMFENNINLSNPHFKTKTSLKQRLLNTCLKQEFKNKNCFHKNMIFANSDWVPNLSPKYKGHSVISLPR